MDTRAIFKAENYEFMTLKLLRKKRKWPFEDQIASKDIAGKLFQTLIGEEDRETLSIIGLDVDKYINNYAVAHVGTLSKSLIHPREIFKYPILSNSHSIIIAHNRPSGCLKPSKQDIIITKTIIKAGEILGIELLDHLIVNDKEYLSIRNKFEEIFSEK